MASPPTATTAITLPPVFISTATLNSMLTHKALISHLQSTLPAASVSLTTPLRHAHATSPDSSLLLMPSWSTSPSLPYIGVKLVNYHPLNSQTLSLPGVHASYVLSSSLSGQTLALFDATHLTLFRTASISALASLYLSREDSEVLVMVGAGNMAPHLIKAHLSARPGLRRVLIWNRRAHKADELVQRLKEEAGFEGLEMESVVELQDAVGLGDIISCATNSQVPLVAGEWLKSGAHLDLVGSFKETMKECDDEAIRKGRVYVDNEAALEEAGELMGAFALLPDTGRKIFHAESIRSAAKQSFKCLVVPVRLRRAIKRYIRQQEIVHMRRNVLRLSESFNQIKDSNRLLANSTSLELVDDPLKSGQSKRWKIQTLYGDTGLTYTHDQTVAYVAARMPAVYSVCYRILREIRRRIPDFAPARVLDFGAGSGSAFWALKEIWPHSLERVNLVEPSQPMQRAGQGLVKDIKKMPLIHSYSTIQALSRNIGKTERKHDLVIASYVLGEIPSLKDRITIVRQLWELSSDILVLVEPGTPQGSKIISQMRSHILWMEKRKSRKKKSSENGESSKSGAFVVAPCPHDGLCPLANTNTYCHFVQRLQRTSSQRAYKRSGNVPLRGFEDEKFSYVAFRRGERPQEDWPLDGIKLETLKELKANRNPEDISIDYEEQSESEDDAVVPYERDPVSYDSDDSEPESLSEYTEEENQVEESGRADLGTGWGRIIFMPQRRGSRVEMDVCRSTKRDGSEGTYEHLVLTKAKNPTLHQQAKKSMWGDLWPF